MVLEDGTSINETTIGGLDVISMIEKEEVSYNEATQLLMLAHITAGASEGKCERAPVSITTVIDRSGSMKGEKLRLVKESMLFVISELKPEDKFGIVSYSEDVREDLTLTLMNEAGKASALKALEHIQDSGQTNLSGGLFAGLLQQAAPSFSLEIMTTCDKIDGDVFKWRSCISTATRGVNLDHLLESVQYLLPDTFSPTAITLTESPYEICRVSKVDFNMQVAVTFKRQFGAGTHVLECRVSNETTSFQRIQFGMRDGKMDIAEDAKDYVSSVWLFTDGMANVGIQKPKELVDETTKRLAQQSACTLYTFGFGGDHNANLLEELAKAGSGLYNYIEKAEAIPQSFAEVLGGLVSVVAQNVTLTLEVTPPYGLVKVLTVFPTTSTADRATITLRDVYASEQRDIAAIVSVPKFELGPCSSTFAKWTVSYYDAVFNHSASSFAEQTLERPYTAADSEPPRVLDQQRNRLRSTEALERARSLGDRGELKEARKVLETCIADIKSSLTGNDRVCKSLISDLKTTLSNMADRQTYTTHGSHTISCMYSCHGHQRSSGKHGHVYMTPTQNMTVMNSVNVSVDELYKNLTQSSTPSPAAMVDNGSCSSGGSTVQLGTTDASSTNATIASVTSTA